VPLRVHRVGAVLVALIAAALSLAGVASRAAALGAQRIGSAGNGPGQFSSANQIILDTAGDVWALDTGSGRVQEFDPSGALLASWQGAGHSHITVDELGNVYVSQYTPTGTPPSMVFRYDRSGTLLASWQVESPMLSTTGLQIAAAPGGGVYTRGFDHVYRFDPAGGLVTSWTASGNGGIAGGLTVAPDGTVLVGTMSGVTRYGPTGDALGNLPAGPASAQFSGARDLATDQAGNVYVESLMGVGLQAFGPDGTYLGSLPDGSVSTGSFAVRASTLYVFRAASPGDRAILKIDTSVPVAAVAADRTLALTGEPVRLDASASYVPFAALTRFEWDLDGDGTFETDTGATPQATATYATAGVRVPAVRITAPGGRTATASAQPVDIRLAPPPGAVGVSIDAGAQFTNTPHVTLRLVWHPDDTAAVISNDGGFANARTVPVAAEIPWTLESSGPERLPKTVYVRLVNAGTVSDQTYQDDIILDQTPPIVERAALLPEPAAVGVQLAAERTARVRVAARDALSGVAGLQFAADARRPGRLIRFRAVTAVATPPLLLRVRDGAGNLSPWRRVAGVPDRTAPALSGLRAARVRGRGVLSFALSEPALAEGILSRVGAGASAARLLPRRSLPGGAAHITVGALTPGRYRLQLVLRDGAGNRRALSRTLRVR
jgi:streptogramin lyase